MTINLQSIPTDPGVYVFKDQKNQVLYIGKAKNLQKRVTQYFAPGSLRKQEMVAKATTLDFHSTKNESEALYLEDNLIKEYQPYYNNLLKADNSYVYIKITYEDFPQILITRKRLNDKAIYIGPKHNTQALKKFLQYLRQVLKFRGCGSTQFKKGKLCSDYYFGICKGRCALAQSSKLKAQSQSNTPITNTQPKAKYTAEGEIHNTQQQTEQPCTNPKQRYDTIMKTIQSFFKGNTKPIKDEIRNQINEASQKNNFERAAKLRDIYTEIESLTEQQTVVLPQKMTGYFIQVKPVGQRRIFIILYFYEGKLIDIIRHKEHQNDKDQDEIIADLQREFGLLHEQKNKDGLFLFSKGKATDANPVIYSGTRGKSLRELLDNLFQSYIINSSFDESNLMNELLLTVQKRYQLKKFPYRIECIDISHMSGSWVSGGLSCLLGGIKYPHGYRKYRIGKQGIVTSNEGKKNPITRNTKLVTRNGSDDYESLKELIERRSKNPDIPDLLLIDGGKGQLNIIKKINKENPDIAKILSKIDIIALGKGEARNKSNILLPNTPITNTP
ncbi:MAG: GIY-YIG nuclease family protein, partial [Candidatus Absconditabacterales bacterium]